MMPPEPHASATIRAFVAAVLRPTPELTHILERLKHIGGSLRVVREPQLHLTLKFYGDVDDAAVPRLAMELDRVAAAHRAFSWTLRGVGTFPGPSRPKVIWVGIEDGGRFEGLVNDIERFSEPMGFPRESRPFTPHVTLARVKFQPPGPLAELLRDAVAMPFGIQQTDTLVLMRSELTPGGSRYSPLHVVRLRDA